jgi:hypothetical protein
MNRLANFALFALLLSTSQFASGAADESKSIREIELDEHTVYSIPVSNARVTTISFPGPISALDGANITVDGKYPAYFQLSHKPGSYFFSVRSLAKDVVTNVNIRWNNKTYVLELQDSRAPWLSVIFHERPDGERNRAELRPVTPGVLLGLLDKAKAYPLLKEHHPEAVEQVDYANYSDKPRVMDYRDFEVRIEEVFRFDPQDTLVFRIALRNKTGSEILYKPQGFSVRVGEHVYFQSISDASGIMPPNTDSPAYFAITGTPTGGRNDISLKNDFTVLISRLETQPNVEFK